MKTQKLHYTAPEIIEGNDNYDEKVDIFSFSVMCYEALKGECFHGKSSVLNSTKALKESFRSSLPSLRKNVSRDFLELVENGLSENAVERPSFQHFFEVMQRIRFAIFKDVDSSLIERYVSDNHLLELL